MLKRLGLYMLTVILTVATIGINVSVQYCYGQYIGVQVNGLQFLTEEGEEMDCCQDDEGGCDGCEHTHHQYQIQSQYLGGQGVSTQPQLSSANWLGFFCEVAAHSLMTVEEGGDCQAGFYEPPPDYPSAILQHHGLRAPPMWA